MIPVLPVRLDIRLMPVYFVKPAVAQIMVRVAVEAAVVTQEIRMLIYWLGSSTTQPHF